MADPNLRRSGIYAIRNTANGKIYVGSALRLNSRWDLHRAQLTKGIHHSILLQRAWVKNGADIFSFEVIEYVDDKLKLLVREQFWMDFFKAANKDRGYNVAPRAGSNRGIKLTEAQVDAMRKRPPVPKRQMSTREFLQS